MSSSSNSSGNNSNEFVERGKKVLACLKQIQSAVRGNLKLPLAHTIDNENSKWVFYRGNPCADYLVIGEAPGRQEAKQGRPFVGDSGVLFDRMIEDCFDGKTTSNKKFLITNCIFARPEKNRDPTAEELFHYAPYLRGLVDAMKPKAIICLGRFSATLIQHGLDVHQMFMRPPFYKFDQNEPQPLKMIQTKRQEGEVSQVVLKTNDEDRKHICQMIVMSHPACFLWRNKTRQSGSSISFNTGMKAWIQKLKLACLIVEEKELPPIPDTYGWDVETIKLPKTHPNYTTHDKVMQTLASHPGLSKCVRKVPSRRPSSKRVFYGLMRNAQYDRKTNQFKLFLTTPDSKSCTISLSNYRFRFYIAPHACFFPRQQDKQLNQRYVNEFGMKLTQIIKEKAEWYTRFRTPIQYLLNTEIKCSIVEDKRILQHGYQPNGRKFIKVSVEHHDMIYDVLEEIQRLLSLYKQISSDGEVSYKSEVLTVCEGSFDAIQQLTYYHRLKMSSWLKFEPDAILFKKPSWSHGLQILGHCSNPNLLSCIPSEDAIPLSQTIITPSSSSSSSSSRNNNNDIGIMKNEVLNSSDHAPSVRLAVDIECANDKNRFPNALYDCVCTISNTIQMKTSKTKYDPKKAYFPDEDSGYWEVSFQLGPCNTTKLGKRTIIFQFAEEYELIQSWGSFMSMVDPDYLVGHNVKRFDLTYLLTRIKILGVPLRSLGRNSEMCMRVDTHKFKSRAFGERVITEIKGLSGWTIIDTLEVYLREKKLSFYSLNFIAQLYLKNKKDDVPYAALYGLLCGTNEDRRIVVDYCLKDARLTDQLVNIHAWDVNMAEFARVNGTVAEDDLYVRGQQIKVLSAVMHRNIKTNHEVLIESANWKTQRHNRTVFEDIMTKNQRDKRKKRGSSNPDIREVTEAELDLMEIEEEFDKLSLSKKESSPTTSFTTKPLVTRNPNLISHVGSSSDSDDDDDSDDIFETSSDNDNYMDDDTSKKQKINNNNNNQQKPKKQINLQPSLIMFINNQKKKAEKKEKLKNAPGSSSGKLSKMTTSLLTDKDIDEVWKKKRREKNRKRKRSDDDKPRTERQRVKRDLERLQNTLRDQKRKLTVVRPKASYQGATVLPPERGLHYDLPVVCVDFAALYPSIMMAYNISPDTIIYLSDFKRIPCLTKDMCHIGRVQGVNPRTNKVEDVYFIKREYWHGLFPATEIDLLGARKDAKKDMAKYAYEKYDPNTKKMVNNPNYEPVLYAVFNGRQLQLKIVCNSGYGFLGAGGPASNKACAAAICAWGRYLIEETTRFCVEKYNAICRGGDTDSTFCVFPGFPKNHPKSGTKDDVRIETVEQAEEFSEQLQDSINALFPKEIIIEYEKAMYPMLIVEKKRYCGIIWEKGKPGRFFSKGMETIRRDSLPFTKETMKKAFDMVFKKREKGQTTQDYKKLIEAQVMKAAQFVRDRRDQLLRGEVKVQDLIMSKQLSREFYDSVTQPHLTVKQKMINRGEDPPKLGERVPFVFVTLPEDPETHKVRKGYQLAEHPDYAVLNSVPINYAHYLDKKFVKPVMRVMKHILRKPMIKRIIRKHTVKTIGGRKRRTIKARDITPLMIEKECEQFLFQTAKARTQKKKNVQTRYGNSRSLTQPKISKEYSPLFKFLKPVHELNSSTSSSSSTSSKSHVDIKYERDEIIKTYTKLSKEFKRCLKICQDCVKREKVICSARQCPDYYPRLESKRDLDNYKEKISKTKKDICGDIEDLFQH